MASLTPLDARSRALRESIIDSLVGGGRGHVGASFSLVEILRVLYDDVLSVRAAQPRWADRDRCILSKGHGCLALYVQLADCGFFDRAELARQCHPGALLGGHPSTHIPGVEASTGALGHGLAIGVGMALAARLDGRPSRVFVIMGDGELNEGSVWEAAIIAAKHRLHNLIAIVDSNKLQSYGRVEDVAPMGSLADKWQAFGFGVKECDGHDIDALRATFGELSTGQRGPSVVIAHTIKGRGVDFAENEPRWHHKATFSAEAGATMREALARS